MKSTPVAYSVSSPTANPNMTQRPLVISFFGVHPKTLRTQQDNQCSCNNEPFLRCMHASSICPSISIALKMHVRCLTEDRKRFDAAGKRMIVSC